MSKKITIPTATVHRDLLAVGSLLRDEERAGGRVHGRITRLIDRGTWHVVHYDPRDRGDHH